MLDPMTAAKDRMEMDEDINGPRPTHCGVCGRHISAYSLGACLNDCRQTPGVPAAVSAPYPPADAQTSRQPLGTNAARREETTMTDAKKLKAEIEETLLRNAEILIREVAPTCPTPRDVRALMTACAGNLAQILAPRLTDPAICQKFEDGESCGHSVAECPGKRAEALAAGIPASVIDGKTKLRDHFSKDYIASQCCIVCDDDDEPHHSIDPIAVSQNRTLVKTAA